MVYGFVRNLLSMMFLYFSLFCYIVFFAFFSSDRGRKSNFSTLSDFLSLRSGGSFSHFHR